MKSIRKIIVGGLLAAVMFGCGKEKITELSNVFDEEATVSGKTYTGAWAQQIAYQTGDTQSYVPVWHPEINQITFSGNVSFTVNNKEVYERFNEGEKASVQYQEVREVTSDNRKLNRKVISYNFVSATPIK